MIKEERFKSILAILLVPVLILAIVGFCMARAGDKEVMTGRIVGAEEGGTNMGTTLAERGYVLYQPMHPGIKALYEQEILESVQGGGSDEETFDSQEDMSLLNFDQIESGDYLEQNPLTVQESSVLMECLMGRELSYDPKEGKFTSTEEISRIETAGFEGFGKQLDKAAKLIQCSIKYDNQGEEMIEPVYYFCCQGVRFSLRKQSDKSFQISLHFNFSSCYAPAKYQEFVKDVVAGGEYFLCASTVGGEIETLTFCKDDTVSILSDREDTDLSKMVDDRRIVFMFRDGKLIDYYMIVQGGELVLDDSDKNLIDKYAKGIGKGYPDKVSMTFSRYGIFHIYRPGM